LFYNSFKPLILNKTIFKNQDSIPHFGGALSAARAQMGRLVLLRSQGRASQDGVLILRAKPFIAK
jgi:hypothetical protein